MAALAVSATRPPSSHHPRPNVRSTSPHTAPAVRRPSPGPAAPLSPPRGRSRGPRKGQHHARQHPPTQARRTWVPARIRALYGGVGSRLAMTAGSTEAGSPGGWLSGGLDRATLVIAALAGCGASGRGRASGPFGWLRPASPPTSWNVTRIHGGARLAYPPVWTPLETDPATASKALLDGGERIDGYLNATLRQGNETLADWSRFRPQHNEDEGERNVRLSGYDHHSVVSLGTRGARDRRLHHFQSELPRDRLRRVWPTLERGGGRRSAHSAVGPAGRHAAASRVELRRIGD